MPSSSQKWASGSRKPVHSDRNLQTVIEWEEMLAILGQELPRELYSQPYRWILAICSEEITLIFAAIAFPTQRATSRYGALVEGTDRLLKAIQTISSTDTSAPLLDKKIRAKAHETLQKAFANEKFSRYMAFWYKQFHEGRQREQWYPRLQALFWICRTGYPFALREAEHESKAAHNISLNDTRSGSSGSISSFECQGPTTMPSSHGRSVRDAGTVTKGLPYHEMPESALPKSVHAPMTSIAAAKRSQSRHGRRAVKVENSTPASHSQEVNKANTRQRPTASSACRSSTVRTKSRSSFNCFGFSKRSPSPPPPSRMTTCTPSYSDAAKKRSKRSDSGWSSLASGGSKSRQR
jgi:hypothetical protein